MSIWSDIAGIGAGIAGFAAAPFTGGASIPAGLSAAGALISSGAVSDAASKQATATTQALNLQQQMYNTTRSDLSPYAQTGTAALGNLRQLTGLPATIAPTPSNPPPGGIPASSMPGGALGQMQVGTPQNPGAPLTTPQGAPVPLRSANGQSPAQMQTSSGYVTMRAPDGTTQQVDAAHVPFYQQKGATVITNA